MAWQHWETFREIAATHTTARASGEDTPGARYCSHTPTRTPNPQSPPTTKPLTLSSPPPPKSSPQTPPQAPGASCESPAVHGLALTLRAGKVRAVTAAVGHWSSSSSSYGARALPRTHLRGIPAWGRAHIPPQQSSSSICQQLQIYLQNLPKRDLWQWGNISPITDWPGMPRKRSSVNQAGPAGKAENVL